MKTGRPKKEKHGTDFLWMVVTEDEYEFPIFIEDSVTDLARRIGKSEMAIRTAISHSERKGRKSQYRRVRKGEGSE